MNNDLSSCGPTEVRELTQEEREEEVRKDEERITRLRNTRAADSYD